MMGQTWRVGIAGYGMVGKRRHQFIDVIDDFEVVAVSDVSFGLDIEPKGSLRRYNDYNQLLEDGNLDALFVCLPNNIAADATIKGLQKNLHVFCEKPPGRNVEDIKAVISQEQQKPDLKLKYGFNHRYHDSVLEALRLVEGGEFGRLVNMRGVYGKSVLTPCFTGVEDLDDPKLWRARRDVAGGGILLDQGIHMLDLMRCFAGEFDNVQSIISNNFWRQDVEDNAYALMKSESGVVAMLHSSATQWRHKFLLELTLEKGCLSLKGILSSTKSYGQEALTISLRDDQAGGNPKEITTNYIYDQSWAMEIDDFTNSVRNDKKVVVGTSLDALRTMELVYRVYGADKEWCKKWDLAAH